MGSLVFARPAPGYFDPGTGFLAGLDPGTFQKIQEWFVGGREHLRDPINRAARSRNTGVETFLRRDVVSDPDWYRNEHVELRRQLGLDDVLTCAQPVVGGTLFLSVHRACGDRRFNDEERFLLETLQRCTSWLLRKLADDRVLGPVAPALPPRLERMLAELLTGRSEREIAAESGLSPHTVHKYVESLYRELQVSSRPELMALYIPSSPARSHGCGFTPV